MSGQLCPSMNRFFRLFSFTVYFSSSRVRGHHSFFAKTLETFDLVSS